MKVSHGLAVVLLSLLLLPLGGCGLLHGALVRSVALESCTVPPGGKRVSTDNLWTVMWNQKTFDAEVWSPMSVAETQSYYTQYLLARGWKHGFDPPLLVEHRSFILVNRGTPWGSFIRWDYQSLDVRFASLDDGTCTVIFHGQFEYAPLTWPRYLVNQGLMYAALPLYPLMLVPNGQGIGQAICAPVAVVVVILF